MAAQDYNRLYMTPHAAMRALQRRISLAEIVRCMKYGKRTVQWPSGVCECRLKVRHPLGKVFVVLDKERRIIITVYRTKVHPYRKS